MFCVRRALSGTRDPAKRGREEFSRAALSSDEVMAAKTPPDPLIEILTTGFAGKSPPGCGLVLFSEGASVVVRVGRVIRAGWQGQGILS